MVRNSGVPRRAQYDPQLTTCMSILVDIDDTVSCPSHLCMGLRGARH